MNYPNHIYQAEPARLKDLVWRRRLEPLGRRMLEHQVTAVVAPAGYGKTVWVSSLLESPGWPAAIWISLDRPDSDPSFLLHHLIRPIGAEDRGSDAWRTLMSLENAETEWAIAAAAFLNDLPRDRQTMLVLDDLDFLYGNPICVDVIEFILSHLPSNIHIVLIARNEPPFRLYRQEIRNQLLRIGSRELLFAEDEARELFSSMQLELSESELSALFSRTEGWAVGLRLLGVYLKQPGSSLKDALKGLQQENSSFYRYIMNEFIDTMPAYLRDFLLDASFLPYLETGLCDAALARSDSDRMLGILRGYGLLSPFNNEKDRWRMHNLVEGWLQDIAAKKHAADYVNAIRGRAAGFFRQKGDINRAVEQCFLSGNPDMAAELIHGHGHEYLSSGFMIDVLYKWIGKLPVKLVENDCWLLFFKGTGMLHVDNGPAFRVLSEAADLAERNGEPKCEAGAILSMLMLAIACGNLEMGETAGRRLSRRPELMADPDSHAEALAAAQQYAATQDRLQEGLNLGRQALQLELPPETDMWVRYTMGYFMLRLGMLQVAREMIEATLAMPHVRENERRLILGYELLIDIVFIMGDFKALDEACQACLDLGSKYGMHGIMGRAYYLQGQRHYRENRLSDARLFMDLAYECYTTAGIVHFANQAAIDTLLLRIGSGESAGALLPQFLELQTRFEKVPYGLGIDYMVNTSCAIAALEAGRLEVAGRLLEKSARRWKEIGSGLSQAGTNLLMAHLALLRGDEESCDNLLREALSAAEAWQWENYWDWHPSTVLAMSRRAIDRGICPDWAAHMLSRWFPEQSRREFGLLLVSQSRRLQAQASAFFRQHFEATGEAVFSIFFLGGFRLFINGFEIEESSWKTKKALELFKFVVVDRHASGKEYLMQRLWPEGNAESNDGKLRMTLSYVRKALAAAGLSSDCVVMRRGVIGLDPGYEIHCDYKDFIEKARAALQHAKAGHPYAIAALEEAARMYAGEFLPEDVYEDFTANLRNALHNLHLEVLAQLARRHFARGNLPAALQACNLYLAQEPVDETVIRMAMEILCNMKKRHKAAELYQNLKTQLAREYHTVPEAETAALFKRIQSGPDI